ncbi:LptF/LptG family permease [Treponema sp. OMZ 792]|uniref:LptF/LptG family permease n=1 Tax=unclassified Treponema TaxID=2638727 RepID=UPI0020A56771|nr:MULTISPECIES: LptF/LptG family permease [unclassified Treponema]UTC74258.1 LptF/LptG family permease [Treponema sp. OMZ 792]UTC80655.1 YjgP/YjgQ family permease [Treponema sp. OMZ 798]
MRLLQRYLLKLFIPTFIVAMLFFILLLQLGDLFANIVAYLQNGAKFKDIVKVMWLYIPKCIAYSVPLAILFAGSYTMGNLYAQNELTSIFSAGISLGRFTLPLLVLGFFFSVGMIFFEDNIVIKYFYEKTKLSKKLLQEEESLDTQDLVILSELGKIVYTADYFNAEAQTLSNAYIIIRDEDGNLSLIIKSSRMVWENDRWRTDDAEVYRFSEKNIVICSSLIPDDIILSEPPFNFQKNLSSVDEMRISEAKEFIAALKKNGLPYYEALSKYHRRFSFPFTIFIVLFFSISLGGKFKKNILLMSILFSLGIATLFYVTEMVTMLSAKWEYISPLAGAWTPIFIFSILSVYLLRKSRT